MNSLFADQGTNQDSNDVVAEFVRRKVREIVRDPGLAEKLCPSSYPIGTRRLCLDIGYYNTFNRDNVTLIDLRSDTGFPNLFLPTGPGSPSVLANLFLRNEFLMD